MLDAVRGALLSDPVGVRGDPTAVRTEHPVNRRDPEDPAVRIDEPDQR
jgi:hypothetical protein